jgi:hypothetical protein
LEKIGKLLEIETMEEEREHPNDDEDRDPPASSPRRAGDPDFHGEFFSNATHRTKTDPDAYLYRKG